MILLIEIYAELLEICELRSRIAEYLKGFIIKSIISLSLILDIKRYINYKCILLKIQAHCYKMSQIRYGMIEMFETFIRESCISAICIIN